MRRTSQPRRESRRPPPPAAEEPSLALSAWVRLLRAHGLILRAVRRRLPADLTLPQFDVLAQLHRHPEGLSPSGLTRALLVTAGNVTGIVRRLEERGLVERLPVPHDRRAALLRLTGEGRGRMAELIPAHARALEDILARAGEGDLAQLRELLLRLVRTLEEPSTP